ncbi:GNAT family N-acetyltransferase [Algicella marina]|uniref:GNAT family N-acetyltransferase n=1 Tax=Algicella marina TaxID=2683284 RepID=A0A6P1SZ93_9RHOB|nr:GNAT family N-acetyltransferase [Algicella marina]QHQ35788.1 GNAT family N-acetyltransferase [Algicella marina]
MPEEGRLSFGRLGQVSQADILVHMSDPRMAEHMPLMTFQWDAARVAAFVEAKEACWDADGLGHWAFFADEEYVGWGGFQKEGDEWDFGLVLRPEWFGLGPRIACKALDLARADARIPFVTFLLPPSRSRIRGLERLGARPIGQVNYKGVPFLKFRLETI